MLVQIPSVSEASDAKGLYKVFNVYLNGSYHFSMRYSQLLIFHTELTQNFDVAALEIFPPKKFSISQESLYRRRVALQRYFHSVCHDILVSKSEFFKQFLLGAQQPRPQAQPPASLTVRSCDGKLGVWSGDKASSDVVEQPCSVEVFLLNGKKVTVAVGSFDPSDAVLEKTAKVIGIEKEHTYYFSLFLERESKGGDEWTVARILGEYESPYLSMTIAIRDCPHRITIRRSFWEPHLASELIGDHAAMNTLYLETILELEKEQWHVEQDSEEELKALRKQGKKKEFLNLAKTLPGFAYRRIGALTFDHPQPVFHGYVKVGRLEMVTYADDAKDPATECNRYPLTRIRCWKVGYEPKTAEYWLAFHFQMSADSLKWITVTGLGVPFVSQCLLSAVNELVRIRNKESLRTPGDQPVVRKGHALPRVQLMCSIPPVYRVTDAELASMAESESQTEDPNGDHAASQEEDRLRNGSGGATGGHKESDPPASPDTVKVVQPARKNKKSANVVENATFEFGTDEDL